MFQYSSVSHPITTLRHVTPKDVGVLVTAIEGEYKAQILTVREIGPTECTLAEYGVRRRSKKYQPPVIKTASLACIRRV